MAASARDFFSVAPRSQSLLRSLARSEDGAGASSSSIGRREPRLRRGHNDQDENHDAATPSFSELFRRSRDLEKKYQDAKTNSLTLTNGTSSKPARETRGRGAVASTNSAAGSMRGRDAPRSARSRSGERDPSRLKKPSTSLSPEKKLRIEYDEERQVLLAKHRKEVERLEAVHAEQLEHQSESSSRNIADLKQQLLESEKNHAREFERLKRDMATENTYEKKLYSLKQESETTKRMLQAENKELQLELDSLKQMHQSYVDLYANILAKKDESHTRQISELATDLAKDKEDALRVLDTEKKGLEASVEKEKLKLAHERQLLFVDLNTARHQNEELRAQLVAKEKEHEEFLRESALRQSDHHTKVALKKLLHEQQEELRRVDEKRLRESSAARAKLKVLEDRYEENLEKMKMDFEEQIASRERSLHEGFDVKLEGERRRHEEEFLGLEKEFAQRLAEQKLEEEERMGGALKEKQELLEDKFERQKASIQAECDSEIYRKLKAFEEERAFAHSKFEADLANAHKTNSEEAELWQKKVGEVEQMLGLLHERFVSVVKQQDAGWREGYKKVKHLRCVQEAFRSCLRKSSHWMEHAMKAGSYVSSSTSCAPASQMFSPNSSFCSATAAQHQQPPHQNQMNHDSVMLVKMKPSVSTTAGRGAPTEARMKASASTSRLLPPGHHQPQQAATQRGAAEVPSATSMLKGAMSRSNSAQRQRTQINGPQHAPTLLQDPDDAGAGRGFLPIGGAGSSRTFAPQKRNTSMSRNVSVRTTTNTTPSMRKSASLQVAASSSSVPAEASGNKF